MIAPVVRVRNRDGDKHSAITFSSAYENAARVAGIAGLNADAAVIAPKQLVMIRESPARTGYGFGRDGQAELCVLQCSLCKMSKIKCGGVIFTAVQSMRVGKMRLCQTKRAGAQIHLPDKRRLASGYRDRQRQSRIIAAPSRSPACRAPLQRAIVRPANGRERKYLRRRRRRNPPGNAQAKGPFVQGTLESGAAKQRPPMGQRERLTPPR